MFQILNLERKVIFRQLIKKENTFEKWKGKDENASTTKNTLEYSIEIEFDEEILLEGDFAIRIEFQNKIKLQFWLNANFIPNFLFKRSKQEFMLVPEKFDSSLLNYSSFNIFSEKLKRHTFNGNLKHEAHKELKPLIFKQENIKIHVEGFNFLRRVYESVKKKKEKKKVMITCPIQTISREELDKNESLNKNYLSENFSVDLFFFETQEIFLA